MPQTPSDKELLDAFVESGNEQAFRRLAERYSGLIFHTALRSLNDRTLAEDVAQRVLGVLAKKAAQVARGNAPLPSWLHRTTVLEARSTRRAESRHHRKKEALMRAPNDSSHSCDSAWQNALPHLDAAIDTLPEADRHVLLLHFVNELTFPEIARRLGKSAAAVQKQSRRALENLQRILGKRGVTLTFGILTAGLTTEMAKAAPLLLLPALGSISSLGKSTTSAIIVKKTTVAAIGTTLLLCGIPLARQQVTIRQLQEQLPLTSLASNAPIRSRPGSQNPTTRSSLIRQLAEDLKAQSQDIPRYISALDYIEALNDDELIQLALETTNSSLPFADQEHLFGSLFQTLAARDIGKALGSLLKVIPQSYIGKSRSAHNQLIQGIRDFAQKDPASAVEWFNNHLAAIRDLPKLENTMEGRLENEMRFNLSYGFILTDAAAAIEILRSVPTSMIESGLIQFGHSMQQQLREQPEGLIRIVRELLPEMEACRAIASIVGELSMDNRGLPEFQPYENLIDRQDLSPAEIEAIVMRAGTRGVLPTSAQRSTTEKRIVHYRSWLESRGYENPDWRVGAVVAELLKSYGGDKAPFYEAMLNRGTIGLSDDTAVGFLRGLHPEKRRTSADVEWIEKIASSLDDPELVRDVLDRVKKNFYQ